MAPALSTWEIWKSRSVSELWKLLLKDSFQTLFLFCGTAWPFISLAFSFKVMYRGSSCKDNRFSDSTALWAAIILRTDGSLMFTLSCASRSMSNPFL